MVALLTLVLIFLLGICSQNYGLAALAVIVGIVMAAMKLYDERGY